MKQCVSPRNEKGNPHGYWESYWKNGLPYYKGYFNDGLPIKYWTSYRDNIIYRKQYYIR